MCLSEHLEHYALVPLHEPFFIVILLQKLQQIVELESNEHQIFVDSVVVDVVPMQIENEQECFEPLLLFIDRCNRGVVLEREQDF